MIEKLHRNAGKRRRAGRAAVLALLVAAVNLGMPACGKGEELTMSGAVSEDRPVSVQESDGTGEISGAASAGTDAAEVISEGASGKASGSALGNASGMTEGQTASAQEAKGPEAAQTEDAEPEQTVVVYLCGAVENAGVYELPQGSRVVDAIRMAGGLSLMADETCVNQARVLADGEQIYIWTMEEREAYQKGESVTLPETPSGTSSVSKTSSAGTGTAVQTGNDRINLNTAGQEELTALPGIGAAKAAAIVAYRQEHGGFSAAEELKNVSGIGDATYEKLKDRITVS